MTAINEQYQDILLSIIRCALLGETTTYEEIALDVGNLPTRGNQLGQALTPPLLDILDWCITNRIPYLTALVVRKSGADQGLPGKRFWERLGLEHLSRQEKRVLTAEYQRQVHDFFRVFGRQVLLEELHPTEDHS